ncbi:hypothetical protein NQZ68_018279 [Dissostichus eleginoides]|nr:hypothetical protein NQZ68_018279 [Dissostichus eleginoides]
MNTAQSPPQLLIYTGPTPQEVALCFCMLEEKKKGRGLDPAEATQPAPCVYLPLVSSMSDYGGLPTNGVGAGMKNDAFADAVQRARQIAAKIGGDGVPSVSNNGGSENYPFTSQKRSLEEADEPDAKKLLELSWLPCPNKGIE